MQTCSEESLEFLGALSQGPETALKILERRAKRRDRRCAVSGRAAFLQERPDEAKYRHTTPSVDSQAIGLQKESVR